jgi:hypothetical protein
MEVERTNHVGYEHGEIPPGWRWEHAQRINAKDPGHRAWPGRDRHATGSQRELEPRIVRKRQRRFEGFDEIIALCSRGLSSMDRDRDVLSACGFRRLRAERSGCRCGAPRAARRPGHPDLLRRRPQGVPRRNRSRVPKTMCRRATSFLIRLSRARLDQDEKLDGGAARTQKSTSAKAQLTRPPHHVLHHQRQGDPHELDRRARISIVRIIRRW